jgi:glycosyltransferase involved in cell wall biosynthesis/CheY-like chemotaxis protein
MRIILHDYGGYAFIAPLSRALAEAGNEVMHVYCASVQTPHGLLQRRESDPASLSFQPLRLPEQIHKYSLLKRWKQERRYAELLIDLVKRTEPDVVISADTPSHVQARLVRECRRADIRFVSWVQDLYGLAAYKILSKKIPLLGAFVGRHFMRLDQRCLHESDAVILITEDFKPLATSWGVDEKTTTVIPNWAPVDDLPAYSRDNDWALRHGLANCVCFLYSGTLAMKHDPGLLLELARRFRGRPEVRVVVVSEGAGADWLAENARGEGLTNLRVFPFQPFSELPQVLATADVLVSILEPDAGAFSVPSKVLTYLCANRPQLLAVPTSNLAVQTVVVAKAGFVVPPTDIEGFMSAAEQLADDPVLRKTMGLNGRRYAERHFDIRQVADQFRKILWDIMADSVTTERVTEGPRPAKRRILVLDDETDFSFLIKIALEGTGDFEVLQINSALKVLEAAREFRPDMILLDCMMPEMSGEDVATQIQADPVLTDTPFVYVTATISEPECRPDARGNLQTFLPKPLRLALLLKCIDEQTGASLGAASDKRDLNGGMPTAGESLDQTELAPSQPQRTLRLRVEKLESSVLRRPATPAPLLDEFNTRC